MDWFKDKYYYDGANARFETFEKALTLLKRSYSNPIIIETGCQRQKDDLGAGMSTSIFAEYISRYGGQLEVVDNSQKHLKVAKECVAEWMSSAKITFHHSDSVAFLKDWPGQCSLLYLDSYDYPIGKIWEVYGGKTDLEKAIKFVDKMSHDELLRGFGNIIVPCQEHCLNEFKAIENSLELDTIVLIDDNDLAGGGKPGLLKPYLKDKGWKCLIDSQQTLWVKE